MRIRMGGVGALAALLAGCALVPVRGDERVAATVRMVDSDGRSAGSAVITEASRGVRVDLNATGLPPGVHGVHFHENGVCEPPGFATAGGHYSPLVRRAGRESPQGPDAQDLPDLKVKGDGVGQMETIVKGIRLRGANSLLRRGGTTLVIHTVDKGARRAPSGSAGGRIACGVVREQ